MHTTIRSTLVLTAVTAFALAGATGATAATPRSSTCTTIDATPVYAAFDSNTATFEGYLFTLSAGRGFARLESGGVDGPNGTGNYDYGHGAEHPDHDGYVRPQHIRC